MFGLIATAIAGAAGVLVHVKSRYFVKQRLRYTSFVDKPMLGVWVGIGATIVATPIVAALPIVDAGTAIALGVGMGTGVAMGVKDSERSTKLLDD
ncbi:MAG TPA: hypothetical protein DCS75_00910 [Gemmatimonadetes bacterium]|nr:hypothetical protein [Gemmatimonadota bacterium]HCO12996.1 hypothetical protein [Gemmatimonadota bacterium]|tara:strand:- start:15072 stop:15356 length:285 start_codon:yes stop_codon:yes gene_type:complete